MSNEHREVHLWLNAAHTCCRQPLPTMMTSGRPDVLWSNIVPNVVSQIRSIVRHVKNATAVAKRVRPNLVTGPALPILLVDDILLLVLQHICDTNQHDRLFLEKLPAHRAVLPLLARICQVSKRFNGLATPFLYHCVARPADPPRTHLPYAVTGWEGRLCSSLCRLGAGGRFGNTRLLDCEHMSMKNAHMLADFAKVRSIRIHAPSFLLSQLYTYLRPRGLLLAAASEFVRPGMVPAFSLDWLVFEKGISDGPAWTHPDSFCRHKVSSVTFRCPSPHRPRRILSMLDAGCLVQLDLRADHQQDLELVFMSTPRLSKLKYITLHLGRNVQNVACISDKLPACSLRLVMPDYLYNDTPALYASLPKQIVAFCPDPAAIYRKDLHLAHVLHWGLPELGELTILREAQQSSGFPMADERRARYYSEGVHWAREICLQREKPVPVAMLEVVIIGCLLRNLSNFGFCNS